MKFSNRSTQNLFNVDKESCVNSRKVGSKFATRQYCLFL